MNCKIRKIFAFSILLMGILSLFVFSEPSHAAIVKNRKCLRFQVTTTKNQAGDTKNTKKTSKTKWFCAKVEDGKITSKNLTSLSDTNKSIAKSSSKVSYTYNKKNNKITFKLSSSSKKSQNKTEPLKKCEFKGNTWDNFYACAKDFADGRPSIMESPNKYTITNIWQTSTDDDGNPVGILEDDADTDYDADEEGAGDTDNNEEITCYDGAGSLGWILCTLLSGASDMAEKAYETLIEPQLVVDANLLSDQNGTFTAWKVFQNFANIAFIILFLIVIFSQITGVGINNYGIKKILPKLAVAVILINLSFIICQLAVDISNILGSGLKGIMDDISEQIAAKAEIETVTTTTGKTNLKGGVSFALSGIGILVGIAGAVGVVWSAGLAIILPLVLGALSIVVAIMFLFILLAVRKAGVIVLVTLAPIAFVCYMLPNTKKIFDKWKSIFIGLLLLYPICGLVVGAGNFVSTLLLSTGDGNASFFMALTAMIVCIIPIFLIPTLLKGSLSAMGNIGAKITGVGNKLRSGASQKVKGSDFYNRTQTKARAFDPIRSRAAQRLSTSKNPVLRGVGSAQTRNLARAQAGMDKLFNEELSARESAIMNSGHRDDIGYMQNGLAQAISHNDEMGIRAYQNVLSQKGENGRQAVHDAMKDAEKSGTVSSAAARTYSSNIMNNWANDYKNNSRSTFDYANVNANADKGSVIQKMEQYEAISVNSLKTEQMATMDDAELKRYEDALYNGKLSAEHAHTLQTLASNTLADPRLQSVIKQEQRQRLESIEKKTNVPPIWTV